MTPDVLDSTGVVAETTILRPDQRSLLGRMMQFELVLGRIETVIGITALSVAVVAMGMSVAIRALDLTIPDPGEWALVAMSPLTFMGAALCSHLHRHLTADVVESLPAGRLLRFLHGLSAAVFGVFGVFFILLAINLFEYAVSSGERLIDLNTPVAIPVGFMLAGAVLMTFHAVLDVWRVFAGYEPGGIDPWH